jgi:phosphate:Na+ symporter
MKDILHNLREMDNSEDPLAVAVLKKLRNHIKKSIADLQELVELEDISEQKLKTWIYSNELTIKEVNSFLFQELRKNRLEQIPVSTMSNVIRQTFSSLENLGNAVMYWKFRQGSAAAL